jgi:hypothetical protein
MGRFVPRVEKNHPNHFGQNKVGEPVKTCRYCQNIWDYEFEEIENELFKISKRTEKIWF